MMKAAVQAAFCVLFFKSRGPAEKHAPDLKLIKNVPEVPHGQ
jgi:hypothetical protein